MKQIFTVLLIFAALFYGCENIESKQVVSATKPKESNSIQNVIATDTDSYAVKTNMVIDSYTLVMAQSHHINPMHNTYTGRINLYGHTKGEKKDSITRVIFFFSEVDKPINYEKDSMRLTVYYPRKDFEAIMHMLETGNKCRIDYSKDGGQNQHISFCTHLKEI